MKIPIRSAAAAVASMAVLIPPALAQSEEAPNATSHPRVVALVELQGDYYYRHFPSNAHHYVYDGDMPGQSNCYFGCASAWPPLYVKQDDNEPVGLWTVVERTDDRDQWAYKGQPVYRRVHASTKEPIAKGVDEDWTVLQP